LTNKELLATQEAVGEKPDGFWGPRCVAACQAHLRKLMPTPNPWPKADQASLRAFYGDPTNNNVIVSVDAPAWLRLYDTDRRVLKISCHRKVAASLLRALEAAYKVAPNHARRYFGCHVDRNMRGGTSWSLHAYGAAIDLAASSNGNHTHWPTKADMPLVVMEAFAREGWLPAGAFWSRDSMHFQSSQ
jgi:hypothetical protein